MLKKPPSGSNPELTPQRAAQKTSTFFPDDVARLEAAEKFVRSSGRKGESALTLRTMVHRAELDARFLELYDELHAKDPRRQKRKPKT